MKKSILLLFILSFVSIKTYTQEHVIILVDVSKSINQDHFRQAKEVVKNFVLGESIKNKNFMLNMDSKTFIKPESGIPLISSGKKLLIMPFGETKWMNGSFTPKIIRTKNDITAYFDSSYPKYVTDQRTYLNLAKAKAAQTAKSQGMDKYILLIVSDNISDDYGGPNSKPIYTAAQRHLINNFATLSNPYVAPLHGKIDFNLDNNFEIRIHHADVSKWTYTLPASVVKDTPIDSVCKLKFTSYANGSRKKAKNIEANPITLRWAVNDAPKGTNFTLSIRSTSGNKENNMTFSTTSNFYKIELPNDTYKITISSPICLPDTTYISINVGNGGGGILLFIVLLGALGFGGYQFYKKRQEKKLQRLSSDSNNFDSQTNDYSDTDNYNEPEGF
ncbi:hypothetical protein [Flavivirga spongiicola]|uniref:VWA domain-containing protein n=1 Tax=Flavivirga spongiicola TaxID=421621 RepID=A0ABU7XZQ1_9FLAO|nr:hypothetical protein [Flavivirga sp. MEBiC05379]MDO5980943.1 hypothetical protein [Flavivirga sp. MEBiC05379]